ncbi:uncharacterized protein LOC105195382 isoform X1 [Solenopsis invicta]|uniref:uncharacterized protein LOC105195382 isoform X1 n=1 Tax=Solenopsis invicta TaxID=13686 RepID=UPI00193CEC1E|nr:uncharacterized protein LOC105195382 isoform X1 [Solenopsis invicta]
MEQMFHVPVKDSSSSVENILRPISYMSWLLGVGIAHPQKYPKAITIMIRIIYTIVYSYGMIYDTIRFFIRPFFWKYIRIMVFIHFLNKTLCYLSAFYYIYHGIRQYNKWPELMDRLKELDQKIRKEISINDRSIKIIEALEVFMTFICFPLMPIIHISYYSILTSSYNYNIWDKTFIIDIVFYYILAQALFNIFAFNVVVFVLYRRFQILNKLIGQLNKLSNVQWIAFKIIRIRELHADICDLASMVNDIYALHLLFFSMNCFTMAAAALFNFYIAIIHGYPRVLIYSFYQIVYVMQFWLICWICTLACQEANITGKIIHKIVLNCKPVNLDTHEASNQSRIEVRPSLEDYNGEQNSNCSRRHNLYVVGNFLCRNLDREYVTKEVNDFLTQLQQNRVAFSACDFFEINNASFGCLVGVIFTYLIIFIQFYEDPKIENKS